MARGERDTYVRSALGACDDGGTRGPNVVAIGSWNADNRSANLHSEGIAVVYDDPALGEAVEAMILQDMRPEVAEEIKLEDIRRLPPAQEIENSLVSILGPLL